MNRVGNAQGFCDYLTAYIKMFLKEIPLSSIKHRKHAKIDLVTDFRSLRVNVTFMNTTLITTFLCTLRPLQKSNV